MGIAHSNFFETPDNNVLLQNDIIIAQYTVTEQLAAQHQYWERIVISTLSF